MRKAIFLILLLGGAPLPARIRLPALFSDHMLLQRDKPTRFWGWADPGERVDVYFQLLSKGTNADAQGRWEVLFPKGFNLSGGPFTLFVHGKTDRIAFHDVLVGDLWLASGQQQYLLPLKATPQAASEMSNVSPLPPRLRFFRVERLATNAPADEAKGHWIEPNQSNLGELPAFAFHFARELWRKTGMPQGVVEAAWGDAPTEAWVGSLALRTNQRFDRLFTRTRYYLTNEASHPDYRKALAELRDLQKLWEMQVRALAAPASNLAGGFPQADPACDDRAWKNLNVPGYWEDQGMRLDGVLWYRRTVNVPRAWSNRALVLSLGRISSHDQVYWEGTNLGGTWTNVPTPAAAATPRRYVVPAGLVTPGRPSHLAVRVFDGAPFSRGGFVSGAAELRLTPEGSPASNGLPLAGPWKVDVEVGTDPLKYPPRPEVGRPQQICSAAWNGMMAPLSVLSFRGVLCWQGEPNASRAAQFRELYPALIRDWRALLRDRELPFYLVQAPNYRSRRGQPGESELAELREAQAMAALKKKVALVVSVDLGEGTNAAPADRQALGSRAAAHVLSQVWKMKVEAAFPEMKSVKFDGGKARIDFDHVGGGLVLRNPAGLATNEACSFALCGPDRRWVWARASLVDKNTVELSHPALTNAVAVRYAWADNPLVNLYSKEGLPVAPFRSDAFPVATEGNE